MIVADDPTDVECSDYTIEGDNGVWIEAWGVLLYICRPYGAKNTVLVEAFTERCGEDDESGQEEGCFNVESVTTSMQVEIPGGGE